MATIIVPAHNEATVIRRCLDSLVNQPSVDKIIVACNGCSDNTADIWMHLPYIKVKTRARLGSMKLKARKLGYDKPAPNYKSAFKGVLLSKYWLSALIYLALVNVFRRRADQQFKDLDNYQWEVDHSSRQ